MSSACGAIRSQNHEPIDPKPFDKSNGKQIRTKSEILAVLVTSGIWVSRLSITLAVCSGSPGTWNCLKLCSIHFNHTVKKSSIWMTWMTWMLHDASDAEADASCIFGDQLDAVAFNVIDLHDLHNCLWTLGSRLQLWQSSETSKRWWHLTMKWEKWELRSPLRILNVNWE